MSRVACSAGACGSSLLAARRQLLPAMSANVTPLASVRVDFNFNDPCYVLRLAACDCARAGDAAVVAALSNHALKLFAWQAGDLRHAADMTGHSGRITDLYVPSDEAGALAVSSSEDCTVRCWDLRSHAESERCWSLSGPRSAVSAFLSCCACLPSTGCVTACRHASKPRVCTTTVESRTIRAFSAHEHTPSSAAAQSYWSC